MLLDGATACRFLVFVSVADHRIVASFDVEKPLPFMEDNLLQLENDITDEISFPMTKVSKACILISPPQNSLFSKFDHSVSFLVTGCGISA